MAPTIPVHAVHAAVRDGRVLKAHNYHAGKRGIAWAEILAALEWCYPVERDDRRDPGDATIHPDGWYALANLPHRGRLRIDFNAWNEEDLLLLVVTAYHT